MRSVEEAHKLIERISEEWPKGSLHACEMLKLELLLDIRQLLLKLAKEEG